MGHHHDLLARVPPDEPCGEVYRDKLALAVARWDVHAHPIIPDFVGLRPYAPLDLHELVREYAVVPSDFVRGVYIETEGDQIVLRSLQRGPLVELCNHLLDLVDLFIGQSVEVAQQKFELFTVKEGFSGAVAYHSHSPLAHPPSYAPIHLLRDQDCTNTSRKSGAPSGRQVDTRDRVHTQFSFFTFFLFRRYVHVVRVLFFCHRQRHQLLQLLTEPCTEIACGLVRDRNLLLLGEQTHVGDLA